MSEQEYRPTDEQLAAWSDPDDSTFPAYWTTEHVEYISAMAQELLILRRELNNQLNRKRWRPA